MNNLMPPCCESGRMLIPYEGGATFGYGSVTPVTPPPGELAPGGFHFAPCGVCNRFNTEWGIHFARAASTATLNSTVAVAGLSRSERGARPGNFSAIEGSELSQARPVCDHPLSDLKPKINFCPDTDGAFPALWPSSRSSRWSGQPFSVLHTKRPRCAGVPARTGNAGWTESFCSERVVGKPLEPDGAKRECASLRVASLVAGRGESQVTAGLTPSAAILFTSEFRGRPFLKSVAERRPSQPNADESRSTRTDGTVLIRDRAGNQTRLSSSSSPSNRHPGEVPVRHQGSLSKTPARETRLTQY